MDKKLEIPDNLLVENYLKKRDENSLVVLIKRHLPDIYGFVVRKVANPAEAQDISQEVFIKVWKNLKKFDSKKNFKTWIFSIAKNSVIDFYRKKKTIPFSAFESNNNFNPFLESLAADVAPAGEIFDQKQKDYSLNFAIKELPPQYQQVVLRRAENLSFREIAETAGESINTIKSRYRRALNYLKNFYKRPE